MLFIYIKMKLATLLKEQLEIVYHGTDSRFNVFNDKTPIFFVDNIKVARTYGDYIIKAKLNLNNPIELDFDGKSTYYFIDKWYIPSELANRIKEISIDIKNGYSLNDEVSEELEYLGWSDLSGDMDVIIMNNIDDVNSGMFSSLPPVTNYVVFNKESIIYL